MIIIIAVNNIYSFNGTPLISLGHLKRNNICLSEVHINKQLIKHISSVLVF